MERKSQFSLEVTKYFIQTLFSLSGKSSKHRHQTRGEGGVEWK